MSDLGTANLIVLIVALLLSVGFHEATHAFASHWLGDTTASDLGRLTLNPLKHLDLYTSVLLPIFLILLGLPPFFAAKPVPFNPYRVRYGEYGAALIGVAGPLSNLFLAAIAALILRLSGTGIGIGLNDALIIFIQINIALFVFNMIPFPPLDGSRLLYAFAPEPVQNIMRQIEGFGFFGILAFIFLLFPLVGPLVISIDNALFRLFVR